MKHSIIIKTIILKISLLPKIPYITRNCSDTEQMAQGGVSNISVDCQRGPRDDIFQPVSYFGRIIVNTRGTVS